jgi:lysophospholipase L1-like esterase
MKGAPMIMRVCFFGDSFVNGTGDNDCQGWVGRLCAAERRGGADITLYNLGIRRDTSDDIRARWRREADARLPSGVGGRLVFSFGLNDCADDEHGVGPRVPPMQTVDNATAILRDASSWLPTLMVGPLPVTESRRRNDQVIALSEQLQRVCERLRVPFYSTVRFAEIAYRTWRMEAAAGDGIHPNGESYAALAEAIRTWRSWRDWCAPEEGSRDRDCAGSVI